jgi:dienelactone hydrolase
MMRRREETLAALLDHEKSPETPEWGLERLGLEAAAANPFPAVVAYGRAAIADSDAYFALPAVPSFTQEGRHVTFPSPLPSGVAENDVVHGTFHDTAKRKRAVVMLGHWNSLANEYETFAAALARSGTGTLRLSLPYHDERKPPDWPIARDMACANVGRVIRANRQAVLDTRAGVEFLLAQGFHRVGVAGASVGAAIATLTAAHEPRIGALMALHIASSFGAVLYQGRATRHIRATLGAELGLEEFSAVWECISPIAYVRKFRDRAISICFLSGRYDRVFHPSLARALVEAFRAEGVEVDWRNLPCGHFTLGVFPFSAYVGATALRFFRRALERGIAPRARREG